MTMKKIHALIILALTFFCPVALAQWENPSERYVDAYKEYTDARCPIPVDSIKNFVYFARDRGLIHNHPFLKSSRFDGAQIMYSWAQLEPSEGQYDFSLIESDYEYLKSQGKKLFVQLQDATFDPKYKGVPAYLLTNAYDGGTIYQRNEEGVPEGWTAKRWNERVQERYFALLDVLGTEFDGKVEGVNLQETAIEVTEAYDPTFTPALYAASVKKYMSALKKAFPNSVTMQYANFMPGEWLPWEDEGYLNSIYQHGQDIGVGLGAPDLIVDRKGQLNHALAMMHESQYTVPLGIAVQDGNYVGETNSEAVIAGRENIVPMLHAFADDFLHVTYMFWVDQEPYFEQDVMPCFSPD